MSDIVDSQTRSRMMAGIKAKNTKPELIVRRFLHSNGFRFRLHVKKLPGTPDIVLAKYKIAIFVHGCFWHRHPGCKYATNPEQNSKTWQEKFSQNISRDKQQISQLMVQGWRVVIIWECGLKKADFDLSWMIEHIIKSHVQLLEWPDFYNN